MVTFWAYVGALWHHWIALLSGLGSLALATGITFQWLPATAGTDTRLLVGAGGVFLGVATYRAFKGQYDRAQRLDDERTGPALSLQCVHENRAIRWLITNAGGDAFNVVADPLGPDLFRVRLRSPIPRIPRDGSADVGVNAWEVNFEGGMGSATSSLESALEYPVAETLEELLAINPRTTPIRLAYTDVAGRAFETHAEIEWNAVTHTGIVKHIAARRLVSPSWWEMLRVRVWPRASRKRQKG